MIKLINYLVLHIASGERSTLVATGQQGMGNIFVWVAPTMNTLAVLQTKQKSVMMLEFSKDGRLLISFGEDKTVVISDWKSNTIMSTTKGEVIIF